MNALTVAEIDIELAARTGEVDTLAATLVDLDRHPGLVLLRGFPPSGRTLERWRPLARLLDLMWDDFGRAQAILDSARAIRTKRGKLGDTERGELTRLLRDHPQQMLPSPIPAAQRPNEPGVLLVGLSDTLERMREAIPRITEFLDAVDAINSRVLAALTPIQTRLDEFGGITTELRAIAAGVTDLLGRSATDPLTLTPADIDTCAADLARRLDREVRGLTEMRALSADWPAAIAETRERLDAIGAVAERAAEVREQAQLKIRTAPLPVLEDETVSLRAELDALAAGPSGAQALVELRRRIAAAHTRAQQSVDLAQGLLDRRAELRGRLGAYQAKAARLGVSEERDVLSANRIAADLLDHKPCDLAAVTRAVADYQQLIGQAAGRQG
ncbi:hypothetical protein [Nocardia alni]|uniref:hypothetical protein n=1 Tax=Nocardia alni TaxID=2815723 RepID=UPI001C24C5E0|nr:hypothetical protein [Nocardia alni]